MGTSVTCSTGVDLSRPCKTPTNWSAICGTGTSSSGTTGTGTKDSIICSTECRWARVCVAPGGLPKQGGRDPSQAPLPRQSSARSTRRLRSSVSVGRRAGPCSSYRLSGEVLTPGPSLTTAAHAAKQQSSQLPPLRGCRSACSRRLPARVHSSTGDANKGHSWG